MTRKNNYIWLNVCELINSFRWHAFHALVSQLRESYRRNIYEMFVLMSSRMVSSGLQHMRSMENPTYITQSAKFTQDWNDTDESAKFTPLIHYVVLIAANIHFFLLLHIKQKFKFFCLNRSRLKVYNFDWWNL